MHTQDGVTRSFTTRLDLTGAEIVGVYEQMSDSDLGSFETG
jgi:hypothetical protein